MTKPIPIPIPFPLDGGFSFPDPLTSFLINDPTLIYPSSLPSPLSSSSSSSSSPYPIPPLDSRDTTTDSLFSNLLGDPSFFNLDHVSSSSSSPSSSSSSPKHPYSQSDMDIMAMIPDFFNFPPNDHQLPSPPAIDDIPLLDPVSPISPYPTINFDSIFPCSLPVLSSSSPVSSVSPIIPSSPGPSTSVTTTPLSTYSLVSSTSNLPLESSSFTTSKMNENNIHTITNHLSYLPTVLPPPPIPPPTQPSDSLPPVAHSAITSLQAYHQHRLNEAHAMVEAIKAAQTKPSGPPPGTVAAAVIPKLVTEKGIPTTTSSTTSISIPANDNNINIKTPTIRHLLSESNKPIGTTDKTDNCNNNNTTISITINSIPSCNGGGNKRKLDIPDEVLPWPSHLVPMDAPIQKKRRVTNTTPPNTSPTTTTNHNRNNNIISLINDNRINSYTSTTNDDSNNLLLDRPASPETAKRIKNTLSARRSRARRAAKMDFLESRVMDLELEVSSLRKLLTDNGISIPNLSL